MNNQTASTAGQATREIYLRITSLFEQARKFRARSESLRLKKQRREAEQLELPLTF
ncbi:MAG: hypothetical protein R3F11_16925 [Verrucomicrobiales bacterium]